MRQKALDSTAVVASYSIAAKDWGSSHGCACVCVCFLRGINQLPSHADLGHLGVRTHLASSSQ